MKAENKHEFKVWLYLLHDVIMEKVDNVLYTEAFGRVVLAMTYLSATIVILYLVARYVL